MATGTCSINRIDPEACSINRIDPEIIFIYRKLCFYEQRLIKSNIENLDKYYNKIRRYMYKYQQFYKHICENINTYREIHKHIKNILMECKYTHYLPRKPIKSNTFLAFSVYTKEDQKNVEIAWQQLYSISGTSKKTYFVYTYISIK
jgi:hypothetical protein